MATKKYKNDKPYKILLVLTPLLFITVLVLVAILIHSSSRQKEATALKENNVSIGKYAYHFSDGKAIKQTDVMTLSLEKVLIREGQKNLKHEGCNPVYHEVIEHSLDRKQVLLGYGCGNPGSRMFAIYIDNKWNLLSPTNHFDTFGIASCDHVTNHNISKDIAPVCFKPHSTDERKSEYVAR